MLFVFVTRFSHGFLGLNGDFPPVILFLP
uniref:Uncharacterized protein n=1 Tax=Rhizophora mucronata TaxID=61149 RepID=A0A2P2NVY1_RHIMU